MLNEFIEEYKAAIRPYYQEISTLPLIETWAEGELPLKKAREVIKQIYPLTVNAPRYIAFSAGNAQDQETISMLTLGQQERLRYGPFWVRLAIAYGINPEEMVRPTEHKPGVMHNVTTMPEMQDLTDYLLETSRLSLVEGVSIWSSIEDVSSEFAPKIYNGMVEHNRKYKLDLNEYSMRLLSILQRERQHHIGEAHEIISLYATTKDLQGKTIEAAVNALNKYRLFFEAI